MTSLKLELVNHENDSIPISLTVSPKTDVVGIPFNPKVRPWQFASPMSKVSFPAKEFKRARVTFTWPANATCECDQVGLLFVKPLSALSLPSSQNPGNEISAPHYVKFGLEVIAGKPVIAVAGSNHLLDWSTWPTTEAHLRKLTIELVRYNGGLVARVIDLENDSDSATIRLFTWPFANVQEDDPDIWIGAYISRPDINQTTTETFSATFDKFEVETVSGSTLNLL